MQKVVSGNDIFTEAGIINIVMVRARPYPPSFRRMAARIIDPAMGAST